MPTKPFKLSDWIVPPVVVPLLLALIVVLTVVLRP